MLEADTGYETIYQATESYRGNEESYGLQLYSTVKIWLGYEILSAWKGKYYFNLEPLVIQPFM